MAILKLKGKFYLELLILGAILFILIFAAQNKENLLCYKDYSLPHNSIFVNSRKKTRNEVPEFIMAEKSFLYPNLPPMIIFPKVYAQIISGEVPNNEILIHEVKEGENLLSIAKEYKLKTETIIAANGLTDQKITVGQELVILPVDGALHIIQEGENLFEVVEKYKADLENVLAFNEIASPEEIMVGQAIIVPDAQLPEPPRVNKETFVTAPSSFVSHNYPYGYCTWWVAQKRSVPAWGNAKDWLKNAQMSGYFVCFGSNCEPKIGAIVSLRTGHPLGHVAYVEEIKNEKIVFSEMNYAGFGIVTKRTLKIGDPRIAGYIY